MKTTTTIRNANNFDYKNYALATFIDNICRQITFVLYNFRKKEEVYIWKVRLNHMGQNFECEPGFLEKQKKTSCNLVIGNQTHSRYPI